jgi:hypothetical protein
VAIPDKCKDKIPKGKMTSQKLKIGARFQVCSLMSVFHPPAADHNVLNLSIGLKKKTFLHFYLSFCFLTFGL